MVTKTEWIWAQCRAAKATLLIKPTYFRFRQPVRNFFLVVVKVLEINQTLTADYKVQFGMTKSTFEGFGFQKASKLN